MASKAFLIRSCIHLGIKPHSPWHCLLCSTDGATGMLKINRKHLILIPFRQNSIKFQPFVLVFIYFQFYRIWNLQEFKTRFYQSICQLKLSWNSCAVHEEIWSHLSFVALLQFKRFRATWSRVMWPSCWSMQWYWCVSCAPRLSSTAVSSLWVRSASAGSQITRATSWWCVDLTAIPAASSTTIPPTRTVCIKKFG